jgi:hypothetical protein
MRTELIAIDLPTRLRTIRQALLGVSNVWDEDGARFESNRNALDLGTHCRMGLQELQPAQG